jgi:hypothetical protein
MFHPLIHAELARDRRGVLQRDAAQAGGRPSRLWSPTRERLKRDCSREDANRGGRRVGILARVRHIALGSLACALLVGALAAAGRPSAAHATAAVPDPERSSTAPTGWHWWVDRSEDELKTQYKTDGDRIVSLQVTSTSPYRFTAALVHNSGVYQRQWGWWYGKTAQQVEDKVAITAREAFRNELLTSAVQSALATWPNNP